MPIPLIAAGRARSLRSYFLVAAAVIVSLLGAIGQAHAAGDAAFDQAFAQFIAASSGQTGSIDPAADAFDALHRAEPANPVLTAYAGATTALQAKTTMMPWKKMSLAEDGLALLDKSLAMLRPEHDAPLEHGTPGSLEVRFVAASTFLAVPDFMNRGARGAKLLADVLANPLLATAPLPFRGSVWMLAARQATKEKRADDARRYLDMVIDAKAPQAAQARAMLNGSAA